MVSVLISVTTADAVTREPTVHTHARTLTVAVHHLGDIRPPPSSPISSPRPATMATVTPSPVDATGTAEGQVTRRSALGHARALQLKWSEIERGNGSESVAHTNSPQRNTSTSVPPATVARGGRGSGLGRTTGRGNAATRANTTVAAGTPAMAGTGAELHQDHHLI